MHKIQKEDTNLRIKEDFSLLLPNEYIKSIEPASHSFTNIVNVVTTNNRKYIHKIYKLDPTIDNLVAKYVPNRPKIIYSNDKFKIEEYVSIKKLEIKDNKRLIANKMKEFHKIEINGFRTLTDIMIEMTHGNKFLITIAERILALLNNQNKVCHNDLQIGNMLLSEDGLIFIDFEWATLNDPRFDLANFFCEMGNWSGEEKLDFIQMYDPKYSLEEIEKLEVVSHYLWYLYGRERIHLNNYNFREYAMMRLKGVLESNLITPDEFKKLQEF